MTPFEIINNLIKVYKEQRFGTQKEYNIRLQIEIAILIFENELDYLKTIGIKSWEKEPLEKIYDRKDELKQAIKLGREVL
jgi:hypothetical protein